MTQSPRDGQVWATTREAEHAFLAGGGPVPGTLAATRFAAGGVIVTREPIEGDRVFAFPGSEGLVGPRTVAELLAGTAIDEVAALGGLPVDPSDLVDPHGFVRPVVREGRLVLVLRPAEGGWVPFEQADPTPCCADH